MLFYFHPADLDMSSILPLFLLFMVVIIPVLFACFVVIMPKENKKQVLSNKEEKNSSAPQD